MEPKTSADRECNVHEVHDLSEVGHLHSSLHSFIAFIAEKNASSFLFSSVREIVGPEVEPHFMFSLDTEDCDSTVCRKLPRRGCCTGFRLSAQLVW